MTTNLFLRIVALTALIYPLAACTHMERVPWTPPLLPQQPGAGKMPLHAVLVLDETISSFKHEFHNAGDTWVYPLGPQIRRYAELVTKDKFQTVSVCGSADAGTALKPDVICIPKAVKADQIMPANLWAGPRSFFVSIEWTMKDQAAQNTLWVATVNGKSSAPPLEQDVLFQQLFDNLTTATLEKFRDLPELKESR